MVKPMVALFFFGGAQGGIGWLMVKSGLEKPVREGQDIHVSPYRSASANSSRYNVYTARYTGTVLHS
jgi:hypothetical protein